MGLIFAVVLIGVPAAAIVWGLFQNDETGPVGRLWRAREQAASHASASSNPPPADQGT